MNSELPLPEPAPIPPPEPRRDLHVQMVCSMIIATIMLAAAMYWLRPVLMPFVLSLFFACGLAPILEWIEKHMQVGRWASVTVVFGLGVVLVTLTWSAFWYSFVELEAHMGEYQERFEKLLVSVADWLPETKVKEVPNPPDVVEVVGAASPAGPLDPLETPLDTVPVEDEAKSTQFQVFLSQQLGEVFSSISLSLMSLLSTAATVLIFMFFLLLGNTKMSSASNGMWDAVARRIRSYIVTKTVISVLTGIAFGGALWIFDVQLAFLFGMLAFLLNYIPNIGPIVASLLPLPLIILHPELSPLAKGSVIALSMGIQIISGNVVEPLVFGEEFEMHPVAVLLSLMFWGVIWGVAGMFLAVPVTVAIAMLLERFEVTRGIAMFICGRLSEIEHPKKKISLN